MKKEIRKRILEMMRKISKNDHTLMSRKIFENFVSLTEYKNCWVLMTYISFDNEPDTSYLISDALSRAKTVCVPLVDWKNFSMKPVQIFSKDDIDYSLKIPQPFSEAYIEPSEIDLIIVPGLAFDTSCNRLGRGKGFYDRFLSSCKGLKIGFAFDFQILETIPVTSNDVKMDMVVTETKILKAR